MTIENETANAKNFVGYEYKLIEAPRDLTSIYLDYYPSFGWEAETSSLSASGARANLSFKRNRKLKNKVEINKLQRQFESGIETIASLEKSKTTRAFIVAMIIGLIGTAFMACSVFAVTADNVIGCIIFAIPGFIGWALPYFVYNAIARKSSAQVSAQIDRQYDELFAACEKSEALLA